MKMFSLVTVDSFYPIQSNTNYFQEMKSGQKCMVLGMQKLRVYILFSFAMSLETQPRPDPSPSVHSVTLFDNKEGNDENA